MTIKLYLKQKLDAFCNLDTQGNLYFISFSFSPISSSILRGQKSCFRLYYKQKTDSSWYDGNGSICTNGNSSNCKKREIVRPLPLLSNYFLFVQFDNSFSLRSMPVFIIVVSWIKVTGAALRHLPA